MFDKPRKGYYILPSRHRETMYDVIGLNPEYLSIFREKYSGDLATMLPFYRVISNWRYYNLRQVYPSYDAGLICENTDVIDDLTGMELEGILPCFGINVPVGLHIGNEQTGKLTHVICDLSKRLMIPKDFPLDLLKINRVDCYSFMLIYERTAPKIFAFDPKIDTFTKDGKLNFALIGKSMTVDAEHLRDALNWTINICILMQSYPNYVKHAPVKIKAFNSEVKTTETHVHLGREIRFEKPVIEAIRHSYQVTGKKMPKHWRVGHWRRQVHGDAWRLEHLNAKINKFEDGREYHMQLIPPVEVNKDDKGT